MNDPSNEPWPEEIRLGQGGEALLVTFPEAVYRLSAELLRVLSPSAEVRGHGSADRKIVAGKSRVAITAVEPCGNYAVRLIFDDGHDSGLYTWTYLADLGRNEVRHWQGYLDDLAATGGRREPSGA